MENKKGVSQVITTVILIALAIVLVGAVWTAINGFVRENLDDANTCREVFEKVTLNNDYTCYNSTAGQVQLSINRGDIEIDGVVISLLYDEYSKVYTLTNSSYPDGNVTYYPSGSSTDVKIPSKESGRTYFINEITEKPEKIEISPKIGDRTCDVTDSVSTILSC